MVQLKGQSTEISGSYNKQNSYAALKNGNQMDNNFKKFLMSIYLAILLYETSHFPEFAKLHFLS